MPAQASGARAALPLGGVLFWVEAGGGGVPPLPQPATTIRINPRAPSVVRGRCIRPPPKVRIGSDVGRGLGDRDVRGLEPAAAPSRSATGAPPHPLGRADRARFGRASSAGPRRWT